MVTNKHVVTREDVDYEVITNSGERYATKVLARDPFQDLAVLQIEHEPGVRFDPLSFGDSDKVQVGQIAIAIGNALGEFQNTVSMGVVSGLDRSITASGRGFREQIENLIQTDAAINEGNSGGPLLNLSGEVIGVNVAKARAENIGFAIPVDRAQRNIEQIQQTGTITYPFLGICWTSVTENMADQLGLSADHGAVIIDGPNCPSAVLEDSAAAKAGLQERDVILRWDGTKLTEENTLGDMIQKHAPGDTVTLQIMRNGERMTMEVTLGKREE